MRASSYRPVNYNLDIAPREGHNDWLISQESLKLYANDDTGQMPYSALAAKFSETAVDDSKDLDLEYSYYARGLLSDRRRDTYASAAEEPHGAVNRASASIQLRFNGSRGDANEPQHPEAFLDFAGDEWRDPRGINVAPDFKKLLKQQKERLRFVRLDADACPTTTGGGVSQMGQIINNMKVRKGVKDRLFVFDRQLDGRSLGIESSSRNVLLANQKSKLLTQQEGAIPIGDKIPIGTKTPQRHVVKVSKEVIRNSRKWQNHTAQSEFGTTVTYTGGKSNTTAASGASGDTQTDTEFSTSDGVINYRAIGLLVNNMLRARENADIDQTFEDAGTSSARKLGAINPTLETILRAISQDSDFSSSVATESFKTNNKTPSAAANTRSIAVNHFTPSHIFENAFVVAKSVKPGSDTRAIKNEVITDSTYTGMNGESAPGARKRQRTVSGDVKGQTLTDGVDASEQFVEGKVTHKYKSRTPTNGNKSMRLVSADVTTESTNPMQMQRRRRTRPADPTTNTTETMAAFHQNGSMDRLKAPMGTKYTQRYISKDNSERPSFDGGA